MHPLTSTRGQRGFSLIELGVVAVIAVLASVVLFGRGYINAARTKNTMDLVQAIRTAAQTYSMRHFSGQSFGAPGGMAINAPVSMIALQNEGLLPSNLHTPWGSRWLSVASENVGANGNCANYTCVKICVEVQLSPEECGDLAKLINAFDAQCLPAGGCGLGGLEWPVLAITAR